MVAECMW